MRLQTDFVLGLWLGKRSPRVDSHTTDLGLHQQLQESLFFLKDKPLPATQCPLSGKLNITLSFKELLFLFWLLQMACGILVPWPEIKPAPPASEGWNLNHWTTREVLKELLSEIPLFIKEHLLKDAPNAEVIDRWLTQSTPLTQLLCPPFYTLELPDHKNMTVCFSLTGDSCPSYLCSNCLSAPKIRRLIIPTVIVSITGCISSSSGLVMVSLKILLPKVNLQ